MKKYKVLIVDDEISIREFLEIMLKREGFDPYCLSSANEGLEYLKNKSVDIILSDINMPDMDGLQFLLKTKTLYPDTPVVMMTAYGSAESAVTAMKNGASDYISKPFQIDEILIVLEKCIKSVQLEKENKNLRTQLQKEYSFEKIVGNSERMQQIFNLIKKVSNTDANILILGESGTGKELVANALHHSSHLKDKPFVTVNCGAIQESLLESEMFGHKRGSFTGAVSDKKGLFEVADGGTLFLDEIGELSLAIQVKLLRAIQMHTFRQVGGTEDIQVSVRIIAATNKDLELAVRNKEFREDLFYRLNVIQIRMPSLRERKEDIPLLANYFSKKIAESLQKKPCSFSKEVMDLLLHYNYPGNVRELENCIERAIALSNDSTILPEHLPPKMLVQNEAIDHQEEKSLKLLNLEMPPIPTTIPAEFNLETRIEDYEKKYIQCALDQAGGVKSHAAKLLGISFRSLRYRLAKYGIADNDPSEIEEEMSPDGDSEQNLSASGANFVKK